MYVCLCHAISDRQIREIVERGAESLDEVQAHLPVASCCGSCEDMARDLIESHTEAGRSSKRIAA
jgi:bacterioferritin-associated ferredoxin